MYRNNSLGIELTSKHSRATQARARLSTRKKSMKKERTVRKSSERVRPRFPAPAPTSASALLGDLPTVPTSPYRASLGSLYPVVEHRGGFLDEVSVQLGDEAVLLRGVRRPRAEPLADDPLHARLEALEERVVQPARVERVK